MILGKIEFDNDIAPELISRMIAEHKRQQMNMERVIDKSAQTHTHKTSSLSQAAVSQRVDKFA